MQREFEQFAGSDQLMWTQAGVNDGVDDDDGQWWGYLRLGVITSLRSGAEYSPPRQEAMATH